MANKNIRGITIEIDGATTGLEKALEGVNKKSYAIQQELKEVETLLKFNPKDTTILAQKQELLSQAVENTGDKLKKLKEAQTQVNEQFEKGEISEEQYRAVQREIIKTESQLKNLEDQLANVNNKWKDGAKAIGEFGAKTEDLGNKLAPVSKAAGAAFAGIVGVGVKAAGAADDINTLSKTTGIGVENLQKFQFASDSIDVSMETLTGSMTKLTRNMASAQEATAGNTMSLQEQEKQAIKVEKAQLAYDNAVKKFGKTSLQARDASIKLNEAQAATPKALSGAAGAFDELKVKITDSNGALLDNEEVFYNTIEALGKVSNETKRDALAMEIFGKSAQDLNPLILGGADALKEMGKAAEDKGLILTQEELDRANELNDTIDLMKAESLQGLMQIGSQLAPVLIPMFQAIGEAISGVITWFQSLDEGTMATILVILGVVAAVAPVLIVIGKIATGISALMTVVGALGPVFALLTGPVGLVIAAIAAVIAIVVLVIKHLDSIKAVAANLGNALKTTFANIKTSVVNAFTGVLTGIKSIWTNVTSFLSGLPGKMLGFGKDIIQGLINGIKAKISAVTDAVKHIGSTITGKIKSILGIGSPSKVMMEMGEWTGEGFAMGIDSMAKDAANAASGMAQGVAGAAKPQGTASTITAGGTLNINITGEGAGALKTDARFVQQVKTAIINQLQTENRSIPNRAGLIGI
jgi:phage-related minor tail protein